MTKTLVLALFAAVGADGARVGDVYVAGDEADFVIEAAGQRIGEHWWIYDGETDLPGVQPMQSVKSHHFQGGVHVTQANPLGQIDVRATGELWTDDLGHPLRFVMRSDVAGTRGAIEIGFADGKATGFAQTGPSKHEIAVAVPPDAYLLANNWIGALELIAALAPPSSGTPRNLSLFVADVAQVIPFELRHQGTFTAKGSGARADEVDEGDDLIEGDKYRDSLGEVVKMEGNGKLFEIEIPAASVKIRRIDEKIAKFTIDPLVAPRADFEREEVGIEHGGGAGDGSGSGAGPVKLAGTITRMKGASGKLPALFFVSGSGSQDREGLSGGIDLGTHELLDRVTEAGFLVLRVDDRGVGGSKGPIEGMSYDDLVADARACVDFLLARADVDAKHVFVIGHSEGGETAPILACERSLAGIVLMAAPGRSLSEILREQKQQALDAAGVPKTTIDAEMAEHKKALELLTRDGDVDPADLRADYRTEWKHRAWYRSHAKHDAIAQLEQVKCPVLIVQGGKDLQVSAERDVPPLEQVLKEAKNRDVTVKVFAGLDHLFKKVAGEKPSFQEYFTPRPVDGEFLDLLVQWLQERAKR